MSTPGDFFELQVKYRDSDMKLLQNTSFYRYSVSTGPGWSSASEALASAWVADIWPTTKPTVENNYTLIGVDARNLFDPSDQFAYAINESGTRVGVTDNLPSFTAAKVTLTHTNGIIKVGRKMLAGLIEGDQAAGLLTLAGATNFAVQAASFLIALADSALLGTKSFDPIVVKRVPIIDVMTGDITGYRLPTSAIEGIYGYIIAATLSAVVTTQNSRKD